MPDPLDRPAEEGPSHRESRLGALRVMLALDRRETVAWALYDWANSAFATTTTTAVFPLFYRRVAAAGLEDGTAIGYWGYTTSAALLIIALAAPVLGALADVMGAKKRMMAGFAALGIAFAASLALVGQGQWLLASVLFVTAHIGFSAANVFYDALLSHLAADERQADLLSAAGYALGYLGGGLLLVLNVVMIGRPEALGLADAEAGMRWSLVSVALWWAVFAVPVFRYVPEPPRRLAADEAATLNPVRAGFGRLLETMRELGRYRQVVLFLVAFWLYMDAIGTISKMGAVYGSALGIDDVDLLGALIMSQFVGVPFAFLFGRLGGRFGAKRVLMGGLTVYLGISVGAYLMSAGWHFWLLVFAVSTVQGGCQALSRSLYSTLVPRAQSGEFFGFYSVSSKFAGILGPLLFGLVAQFADDIRLSTLSLVVLFGAGLLLLSRVDVAAGREVARRADADYKAASAR